MADVFISYANEDRDRVRPLTEALQQHGFSVLDRALADGAVLDRELKAAKVVIVVWSEASTGSSVREEAARARDDGRLVQLMLDRVDLPIGFGAFQAEDFTRWTGGASTPQMEHLEEALKAKIEGRDVSSDLARKRRVMARIGVVSALAALALIAAIAWGVSAYA